jgi:hypothetical protein
MNSKKIEMQIDALKAKADLTKDASTLQYIFDEIYDLKTLKKEIRDNNL